MPTTPLAMLAGIVTLAGTIWSADVGAAKRTQATRSHTVAAASVRTDSGAAHSGRREAKTQQAATRSFLVLGDSYIEAVEPHRLHDPAAMQKLHELGVQPLRVIYANIQENRAAGIVDGSKIVQYVKQHWGPNPSGYFMLDYEVPFLTNLQKGFDDPDDPKFQATRDSMLAALHLLRQEFPNAKWTFYGVPGVGFYIPAEPWPLTWAQAPEAMRNAELERRMSVYAPFIEASGWFSPVNYDLHEASKIVNPSSLKNNIEGTKARLTTMIEMSRSYLASKGMEPKPVIPLFNLYFGPGGNTEENRPVPVEELLSERVTTALEAGVDGIALWSAVDYYVKIATLQTYPDPKKNGQARVRKVYRETMLDGVEPVAWNTPSLRADLLRRAGQHLVAASEAILNAAGAHPAQASSAAPASKSGGAAKSAVVVPGKSEGAIRPARQRSAMSPSGRSSSR